MMVRFDGAACYGSDSDLWFPVQGARNAEARQACAECPAIIACHDYAVRTGQFSGIWGNTTERDRRDERRRLRREAL